MTPLAASLRVYTSNVANEASVFVVTIEENDVVKFNAIHLQHYINEMNKMLGGGGNHQENHQGCRELQERTT